MVKIGLEIGLYSSV